MLTPSPSPCPLRPPAQSDNDGIKFIDASVFGNIGNHSVQIVALLTGAGAVFADVKFVIRWARRGAGVLGTH